MKTVVMFTDGSCANTNAGGWGGGCATLIVEEEGIRLLSGYVKKTTNNMMELYAIIRGLKYAESKRVKHVIIVSDSLYALEGIQKQFYKDKNRKNLAFWLEINYYLESMIYTLVKVKGHSGDPLNEIVHEAANAARINRTGSNEYFEFKTGVN